MTASVYPDDLPCPQALPLRPTERRLVSELPGPRQYRGLQRDFHGRVRAQWTLTASQARQFDLWWRYEILRGGLWFSADWPLPSGEEGPVFRFSTAPLWTHLPGGLWRVTAELEVRGRGMPPRLPWTYLTSRQYPLTPEDEMRVSGDFLGGGFLYWPTDHMTVSGDFMAATIDVGLVSYEEGAAEEVRVAGDFLEGTLTDGGDTVLYEDWPPEEMTVAGDFVGGTIDVGLVSYEDWPAESVSVGGDWLDGSLT